MWGRDSGRGSLDRVEQTCNKPGPRTGTRFKQLVSLSEWLRTQNLDVHSLLVVKDDKLIFERYSKGLTRDHNYELYSITKGVTARWPVS